MQRLFKLTGSLEKSKSTRQSWALCADKQVQLIRTGKGNQGERTIMKEEVIPMEDIQESQPSK